MYNQLPKHYEQVDIPYIKGPSMMQDPNKLNWYSFFKANITLCFSDDAFL
jgi:hypothetical protein